MQSGLAIWVLAAALAGAPATPGPGAPAGAVAAALRADRPGSADGVGRAATAAETDAASRDEYFDRYVACAPRPGAARGSLAAFCSPPVHPAWAAGVGADAPAWVACIVAVSSLGRTLRVAAGDFRFVADDGRAVAPVPPELGLGFLDASAGRDVSDAHAGTYALLLFPVPEDAAGAPFLLVWNRTGNELVVDERDASADWEDAGMYARFEEIVGVSLGDRLAR